VPSALLPNTDEDVRRQAFLRVRGKEPIAADRAQVEREGGAAIVYLHAGRGDDLPGHFSAPSRGLKPAAAR
jgi:hypothetical protein